MSKYFLHFILCAVILYAGCRSSSPTFHIREDIDYSFIKKVAVLPLDNLSDNRSAGEIVRQVVMSELLASGFVDVAVPGEVISALTALNIKSISSLNEEQIKAIGNALKVQAVIMGAVEQYGESKYGNFSAPELTITLMMADTTSGSIIWSITKSGGGTSFMARHFGAQSKTMSETVILVVREAIKTFTGN